MTFVSHVGALGQKTEEMLFVFKGLNYLSLSMLFCPQGKTSVLTFRVSGFWKGMSSGPGGGSSAVGSLPASWSFVRYMLWIPIPAQLSAWAL